MKRLSWLILAFALLMPKFAAAEFVKGKAAVDIIRSGDVLADRWTKNTTHEMRLLRKGVYWHCETWLSSNGPMITRAKAECYSVE